MVTLSDLKDLLWFENISPHNEPLFPLLGFGMLSIKQLGILGSGIMLAWGIWQKTGDYLAIIPAVIVLILTFKKENVIPIEIKIIKIFLFYIGKHDKPLPKVRKNTIKSKSNGDQNNIINLKPKEFYPAANVRVPHSHICVPRYVCRNTKLIVGGLIDRIKFSALVIFVLLWGTFVYDPIAHWVWGGGYIGGGAIDLDPDLSPSYALDFAGGTVVHISSGFSALAGALILGRRLGYGKVPMEPHNVPMVVLGASILWFGWFGFNAGSEVMVDGITVSAWVVTNTATGVAAVTWVLMSWAHTGKPSIVGAATGAVAGLVAITPASGWVGPMASIIIGIAAGTVCYGCVAFKNARKWDDALDVWGVHGMGGLTGAILTGTLASPHIWDTGDGIGAWTGTPEGYEQQAISIIGAAISVGYAFGVTIVILKVMDAVWPGGIRVTPKEEEIGLDLAQHGEQAYVNE